MRRVIFTVILVSWALSDMVAAQTASQTNPAFAAAEQTQLRKKAEEATKHWLKVHLPITIFGKIVDQNNVVVPGAEVDISWREPTLDLDLKVRSKLCSSDDEGIFACPISKGTMPIIRNIKKDGYEFVFRQNPTVMLPMDEQGKILAETSREKPIILRMRKKGGATFLLNKEGQLIRVSSAETQRATLDVLKQRGKELPCALRYSDLAVEVAHSQVDHKWRVTYSATNGTDGLVASNDLLYESPQEGYQKKVVLNGPPWPRYLYLRSRLLAIYSRIDLEHSIWKESETNQGFRIRYNAWINPYGSRNLEYESDLTAQWQLRKQLEREARADLLQNKRPTKPDLPKLIKEAEDKAEENVGRP
ncbi:MAG: hypothetical protein AB7T27_06175 [Kiritimatiellia bacterium]